MSKKKQARKKHFYGTTTLGEKGQIVIPKQARTNMGLKKGDHLLVFGMHDDMLAIAKLSQVEEITAHISQMIKGSKSNRKKRK